MQDSNSTENLAALQERVLRIILRVTASLGLAVYIPSVNAALKNGLVGVIVLDTIALLTVFALLALHRLPFRWRAGVLCLIFYSLGVGLLVAVGSVSQIYLLGFSVVTVLLLGIRAGLAAVVLSSISLLTVGVLGRAAPELTISKWTHDYTEWMTITGNFALVDTLLTLGVGSMLRSVNDGLERAIASGISLDQERKVLRTLIDTLPDVVFTKDTAGRFVNCNPATLALLGFEREAQVAGKTVFELYSKELAEAYAADDARVMAGEKLLNREEESVIAAGKASWLLTTKVPLFDATGASIGLLGISRDITDRRRVEAERDHVLAQLQLQIERMPLAYVLFDKDFLFRRWNPAAERIFGFSESEVLGKHPFDVMVPAEAQSSVGDMFEQLKAGSMNAHGESQNRTKDGRVITCEWQNTPLFDDDGTFLGVLSLATDVTDRRGLEGQLRQAQKMEAVGQLAGGIAHDFNNILSVILSYSDLLIADFASDDPKRGELEEIRRAGMRASDLTRQLLTFSRRQVIAPKVLDLNEVLAGVAKMLERLLGEDVELASIPDVSLGRISADPGSVEQVIVNLVVNARDAMPTGGKLTIETANVTLDEEYAKTHLSARPGAYVMLTVSDTGCGMDKPTLAHIFEPFFTTKEVGKGTGLGLSTVLGVVQQSGGTVYVYSEPGMGTTFKVYFPRVDEVASESPLGATAKAMAPRGSETILLVEDEDQVRDVARGILLRQGYQVLEAQNAGEALLLSKEHGGKIHLLLTDVVMPKMSGPALAKRLAITRPDMKVLCMSGYTDDAAVRHGVIAAELAYLQKPITVEALTRAVRRVLDAR